MLRAHRTLAVAGLIALLFGPLAQVASPAFRASSMGSIESARLYIDGSDDDQVAIVLPEHDPTVPINATTTVRARVTLSDAEINQIGGEDHTYYRLRVRLYEEDNSSWPWGDDDDDRIWERLPRLQGLTSEMAEIEVPVLKPTLEDYGAEYYATVSLQRVSFSSEGEGEIQITGLNYQTTNKIEIKYSELCEVIDC